MRHRLVIVALFAWISSCCFGQRGTAGQAGKKISSLNGAIDWQQFLKRSDMQWTKLPDSWDRAPFVGNGHLGTIFWVNKSGAFNFEVSLTDLYDHRDDYPKVPKLFSKYRLPNGHFELLTGSKHTAGSMTLDLWNAEARGEAKDSMGNTLQLRCFTYALKDVIVLEVTGNDPSLQWFPDSAKSTRGNPPAGYKAYPPQVLKQINDVTVSVQEMPESIEYNTAGKGSGQYATAWTRTSLGKNKYLFLISMGASWPGTAAANNAIELIRTAKQQGLGVMEQGHRQWWHQYYPKSFLSVPDAAMESFYWIQLYKMGSAARQGGTVIDLMGPWFMPTGWPAIWWNLNIQLAYWPFYMSNHLGEAEPMIDVLWNNRDALANNAAPYQKDAYAIGRSSSPDASSAVGTEVGNLPWVMHNLWMYYRSSMDDQFLREKLFPLMKGSFKYLQHIVVRAPDGTISLPKTASPEYTDAVENSNYTLACLRWLSATIITADARLKAADPVAEECKELLAHLVPYEVDSATGFMVGKNMIFEKSHRHWSHLFMIYPFYEYSWDDPAQVPLIKKSLQNWISMPNAFAGYSWLGASSMMAAGGLGDSVLKYLHIFLKRSPLPNTMYREGFPVIETPLAFARTVQELLMTSYGDRIRIFPGVPSAWKDITFADMRAEGAFLVTAERKNGMTRFVQIKSLAGEPCRVATGMQGLIKVAGTKGITIKNIGEGLVELVLKKGETALLYTGDTVPSVNITPVAWQTTGQLWGEKKPL